MFIVAHFKRCLTSPLGQLDCNFQQSFTTGKKLKESKSVITPCGHVSGKIWTSIFRVRPFPPFSRPFPPFPAVFCPLNFLFCSWFSMFFLVYLVLFMATNLVVFTSVAFWKDAANAKMQQTIPVRQHFVGNDRLADRFSHAETMFPVLGDVMLLRFEIGFTKALSSQVLKSKQCPLSFTHARTIYNKEKRKNKDYNKNSSENKKCLTKANNASDQLEAPQTLRVFSNCFSIYIYTYMCKSL